VNAGSSGYFLTEYAPETVAAFSRKAATALTAAERIGLLGDEWWMARSGRHDVSAVLDLSAALANDHTPEIVGSFTGRVAFAAEYLADEADKPAFQAWIRARFGPPLERLGLPGSKPDEKEDSRRAALLDLVGTWGDNRELQQQARQLAAKYVADASSLPATLAGAVLRVAAYGGDAALYDQYFARLKATAAEPEMYYRYFNALQYFRDPALIDRTVAFALSSDVRSQDAGFVLAGLLASPWSRERTWAFVTREWPKLTERLDTFQGLPAIVNGTASFCSADAAANVKQFFTEHPLPTAERTIQQSLEKITGCAALKARQGPALKTWLRQVRSSSGSVEFR
jgi:aminopeptidase N